MSKDALHQVVADLTSDLKNLSDYIYDNPELGLEEYKSSQAHVDLLTKHGFEVTYPYLGFETAFRATYDSGKPGPTVAYLSEYDALPGIGHGCGHNMLGTVDTGAGIALSKVIDQIGGRVVVLGTPAEETDGVKVDMAASDCFDDIDVALCTHPSDRNTMSGESLAMEALEFEFFGHTSHAAAAPWEGKNALDAVINFFNLINAFRQQMRTDARIHGIIVDGGQAANVIPDYTRAQFYVRALDLNYLNELHDRVIGMAEAASQAAGCQMKWHHYEKTYHNLVTNQVLNDCYNANAADLGIEMLGAEGDFVGSLDMGNVSQVVPSIHAYYDIVENGRLSGHTVEFRDCTKTDYGYAAMVRTVEILARTGYDVISQPDLLENIQKEFVDYKQGQA
ncbi:amidohydrolase [Aerococcus urinaehominis]|uniref:Peptidase M20 domain-containing protein 2 n=1 Tax=Aerococcus urinaehominis TaxID=128944 RepID=A0A0X8FJF9_9LACT|nr:M20 family metallopeptidase [Aerococcus urinaehominis]AMB98473.1 amidohydrolase [Aerococcus urinaehominis]SDL81743.1 amidohydrolase [Aerococcus urinaehominis]